MNANVQIWNVQMCKKRKRWFAFARQGSGTGTSPILTNFFRISRQIPEKSDVCRFSINFAKTNSKIAEIQNSEIFENYSILYNIIHSCPYLPSAVHASMDTGGGLLVVALPVEFAAVPLARVTSPADHDSSSLQAHCV